MTTIVTYGKGSNKCELVCKKDTIIPYRKGTLSKAEVLVSDSVYQDHKKGHVASRQLIETVFGSGADPITAIDTILEKGEFNMSTNELRALKEQAYRAVIAHIKRTYLNPSGDREYTESTIASALEACNVKGQIDHRRSAEANFDGIKKKLLGKFPMKPKPGSVPYSVHLNWKQHGKLYGQLKQYVIAEHTVHDGYDLDLLVPPQVMEQILRLVADNDP